MSAEELGKIPKRKIENITTKRKAYLVAMLPNIPFSEEYTEKLKNYWDAIDAHITQMESKAGPVKKIFVEGIIGKGDDAELMLEKSSPLTLPIIKSRLSSGAKFESYEEKELFEKFIDLGRCLQIGLISEYVTNLITTEYKNTSEQRYKQIINNLDQSVEDGEGMLLIGSDIQNVIPDDMEKFFISPPELDDIHRWIRDNANNLSQQQTTEEPTESEDKKDSKLWTPD